MKRREGEALNFFQVNDSVSLYHHSHIKSTFPKGHFFNLLRELRHLTKYDSLICTGHPMLISFSMAALPRYHCQADDAVLRLGKGSKRGLW